MPDYSIITCVSKQDVYDRCVLSSINACRHHHNLEIIPIDNTNNKYSASVALNLGIDVARSDVLIFCHQDIRLLHNWFDILYNLLELPEWAVIGSAGINLQFGRKDIGHWGGSLNFDTVAVGNVWSDDNITDLPYWDGTKEPAAVHCIDECLFVLKKSTGLRFDTAFNGFHFYGIDICLQARAAAYNVYSAYLPIIHYGKYSSSFSGDKRYWSQLRFLHSKWQYSFPEMLATHLHWAPEELTSYIPYNIESDDGRQILLKATGIKRMELQDDKKRGIIQQ